MQQLPAHTVRLLSSSQVVTSVLNVVKELMENALDAGATSVDVKLENFGLQRVEVRDDGAGIRAADAPVMAVRHFTSKICSHHDLEALQTYGFRGEALGSICAVAEVTVTTKTREDEVSTQYTLDSSGNVLSQRPSHLGQGTTVTVQKMFKNLPVRKQVYSSTKKCKEELKKIQDLLTAFAIVKPELRLTLYHNKVLVWQKSKMSDHRSALAATLGPGVVANLVPVHLQHHQPQILLEGFFPKAGADSASISSSSSDKSFIFINSRPVQHKHISKLIRDSFSSHWCTDEARGRFPTFVLRVCVPAAAVDVNVTPDKTHVLLHHEDSVLAALEELLVSLYGSKTAPAEKQPGPKPSKSTKDDSVTTSVDDFTENTEPMADQNVHIPDDGNDRSVDAANGSSSSSAADGTDFSVIDDLEQTEEGFGAGEEWSRGTALRDSETNQPLRPVTVLQPTHQMPKNEKKVGISGRQVSTSMTEKRAALTAHDVLADGAVKASRGVSQNPNESVFLRWKTPSQDQRKRFEDRTQKLTAGPGAAPARVSVPGQKRKPASNQQLLDELFSARPQKRPRSAPPKPSRSVRCSLDSIRRRLARLSAPRAPPCPRPGPVCRLSSRGAWLVLSGRSLMVLNPFRVEEALLFQRLLQEHHLPPLELQEPLELTQQMVGGAEMMATLRSMEQSPEPDGGVAFSDPRLVANGFGVKLCPARQQVWLAALAECVPFVGVADLREILTAIVQKKSCGVSDCRPLKVHNYLKGEAVRLVRQMPSHISRAEVTETLRRMNSQLRPSHRTCLHQRPFLQLLVDLPDSQHEAPTPAAPADSAAPK